MSDIIIIGGGPAGVSAAVYALRSGASVTIIKKDGGALEKADLIENYYGFAEPITGPELLEKGMAQAKRLGAEIIEAEAVGMGFTDRLQVMTTAGDFEAYAVVLSTGSTRNAPRIPGLKEFEGKGVSYCAVCDGFFCRGKDVAVLGSGQYALHEAMELQPVASSVTLLTNGETPEVDIPDWLRVDTRKIASIEGGMLIEKVTFADGESMDTFRLFVAVGTAGSADLARKAGAVIDGTKITVDDAMATNVPGLFAAGDCTGGLAQVAKAVHEGAVAGMSAGKYVRSINN